MHFLYTYISYANNKGIEIIKENQFSKKQIMHTGILRNFLA